MIPLWLPPRRAALRLVFLNACETARSNTAAPFAGVATALLRAGLPAVIAMQRPIRDDAALEFSRTVYRRLAAGDPIDAAVTEGRLAIYRDDGALLEWGTPVLFSRAEDGRIVAAEISEEQSVEAPLIPAMASPAESGTTRRVVLGILLAAALGIATWQWPRPPKILDEPSRTGTPIETATPVPTPEETPKPKETPVEPPKPEVTSHPVKPKPDPPRSRSSYEIQDGESIEVAGLAEVGAQFFERAGYALARFSVTPKDLGMLQQPPVMGTGTIDFPAENGTYHLDVLSLDKTAKRATVRLRFEPATSSGGSS